MNAVERVKSICKERNIPISRLEKDLKFSNAYISGLKKGTFPDDRLLMIAEYLNVSPDYLSTGKESEYTPEQSELDLKITKDLVLKEAIKKYYSLPEKKQKYVIDLINLLSEDEK